MTKKGARAGALSPVFPKKVLSDGATHQGSYDLSFLHWLSRTGKQADFYADEDLELIANGDRTAFRRVLREAWSGPHLKAAVPPDAKEMHP